MISASVGLQAQTPSHALQPTAASALRSSAAAEGER
jgi:hypothetical protein